jgi:tetratricopeptide (TPR) repeat protein
MEILANQGRDLYWKGQYQKSLDIFLSLTKSNHPSTPLYFNESAQCQLALGNLSEAEKNLRNVDNFFMAYNTADREEKALSKFGEEAKKIYLGDPYERATNYLLLTLIYIAKEDYENALAACKSGILANADAKDGKYDGDHTLLQLMEMKLLSITGKNDNAAQYRESARKSYINTHPSVRDIYSERLDKLEMLALSDDERSDLKIKESPDEIKAKIKGIEEKLAVASRGVNPEKDLGALFSGNYNALIVVPLGKGPSKSRKGKDGQLVVVNTDSTNYQRPSIFVDGEYLNTEPVKEVANVNYHAVTRGGRKMDAILQGKAAFRGTTVSVGKFMTDFGNAAGGWAGLAIALVGAATQGVGGAMAPEADTRCWQSLPAAFEVYALNLPAGEHEIKIAHTLYFETQNELRKKIIVGDRKKLAAVIAPPAPVGRYSEIADAGSEVKWVPKPGSKGAGNLSFLVTPPLGLKKIDRFPVTEAGEKPEAIAPDWKKIAKKIEKRLARSSVQVERISHQEITSNYESLVKAFPLAFQAELETLDLKKEKDDKVYSVRITFTIVETGTGRAKNKETVTGIFRKLEDDKTGSTDAYYKCIDDALEKFFTNRNLTELTKDKSKTASL